MNAKSTHSSKVLYFQAVNQLIPIYGEDESRQLSKMLVEDVLNLSFEKVMIDEKVELEASTLSDFENKVDQLIDFEPIQYVLGKAHFYGREFAVNQHVLIPRQETEELIGEIVLDNKRADLKVLDIGSGSGSIAITLALELKNAKVTALDISGGALDLTLENAKKHSVDIECVLEDILSMDQLPETYDIIVSNPPYVTWKEKKQMRHNVLDHEPEIALFVPDEDPLKFYKKIIALAKNQLNPKGKLYFEINENFGVEMIQLCEDEKCACARLILEINGKDRFIKTFFD